jgi:LAO/AO transport system kinase
MLEMRVDPMVQNHETPCDDTTINPPDAETWSPPVVCTVATQGTGIDRLAEAIDAHREFLRQHGRWDNREMTRVRTELEILVRDALLSRWRESLPDDIFQRMVEAVASRRLAPQQAVEQLISNLEFRI